jgi:AcrR family transcriptional regulator
MSSRRTLSSRQIAAAALEIADREGIDGLTMAAVAERLGVGTMTLYGYFRSKDELLDAVLDEAVRGFRPASREGTWRERLEQLAHVGRENLERHPAMVAIRFRRPVLRPEALRFGEAALGILLEAGLDPREATQSFRLFFTYVFGFAGLSPRRTEGDARRHAAAAIALLPPERYPNLTAAAAEAAAAMGGDEQFQYGLDRILDGIEARLADRRR